MSMRERRTLAGLMDMTGRVAVVTGGAGHIGRAFCEALAEVGASVVVVDCVGAKEAAAELSRACGNPLLAVDADLAAVDRLEDIVTNIREKTGRLDALIHCASLVGTTALTGWAVPFQEQGLEAWRAALDVNLTSAFRLTQVAAPLLAGSGHGSVVFVGSIYGIVGPDWRLYEGTRMANPAGYAASKGALLQLTRWLATTLAPAIRVNMLSPGGVERGQPASFRDAYRARTPLGRMATAEDLKGALTFLASDLSAYVTGQNVVVDGGFTAW